MRRALAALLVAGAAHADPLPDAPAFCELTPCLPGSAHRRLLARDETIGGVRCKHGNEVGTDDAGKLMFCTTTGAQTLDGLPVAGDSYTLVHANGRVYQTHLARPHDFAMADRSTVACAADFVAVYDDGALDFCTLRVARSGGRAGTAIAFHPGGKLAAVTLDAAGTAGALNVPAGTRVAWDASGAATGGSLAAPLTTRGVSIAGDFTLHGNGQVHDVELAADATVAGHAFPKYAKLELRDDGTLEGARWLSHIGAAIHGELVEDTTIETYDHDGKVTSSYVDHYQATERPSKFDR